ncbi:hypothetical protein KAW18_11605 [candidate division WOR-3 bacterium]|nr:hypothetical protein [candidate division WOR-3 bacterium]
MIPISAGAVRYAIDLNVIVASTGSLLPMYILLNAENNPINKLFIVTISAGLNSGIVNSIIGHLVYDNLHS